jgi:hypothetical protein
MSRRNAINAGAKSVAEPSTWPGLAKRLMGVAAAGARWATMPCRRPGAPPGPAGASATAFVSLAPERMTITEPDARKKSARFARDAGRRAPW